MMALLLMAASTLAGPSRRQKRARKPAAVRLEPQLAEPLAAARKACGASKLRAEMDWESFQGQMEGSYPKSMAAGFCAEVVEGLGRACGEADRKPAAAKKIQAVRCGFKKEALRLQAELKGKTIFVYYSWETPNLSDEAAAWLRTQF
jgi:hypothetical protein